MAVDHKYRICVSRYRSDHKVQAIESLLHHPAFQIVESLQLNAFDEVLKTPRDPSAMLLERKTRNNIFRIGYILQF